MDTDLTFWTVLVRSKTQQKHCNLLHPCQLSWRPPQLEKCSREMVDVETGRKLEQKLGIQALIITAQEEHRVAELI